MAPAGHVMSAEHSSAPQNMSPWEHGGFSRNSPSLPPTPPDGEGGEGYSPWPPIPQGCSNSSVWLMMWRWRASWRRTFRRARWILGRKACTISLFPFFRVFVFFSASFSSDYLSFQCVFFFFYLRRLFSSTSFFLQALNISILTNITTILQSNLYEDSAIS